MDPEPGEAWFEYLGRPDEGSRREAKDWAESRPPQIRRLCYRRPPGTAAVVNGRAAWLVGYAETDAEPGFWFSHTCPADDYDKAVRERFVVCAGHAAGDARECCDRCGRLTETEPFESWKGPLDICSECWSDAAMEE